MSQYLPYGEFKWFSEKTINRFCLNSISENSFVGYILKVDLGYPSELLDLQNNSPLVLEKLEISQSIMVHRSLFSTNPLFSNVSSVILHSLSRNCFTIKLKFFTYISKSVVTYIIITVTNISNSTVKQYYGIIKTFKVLVIVKKKQFSRTNILI